MNAKEARHLSGWAFVLGCPDHLGVAVSGGGDSMALLDLMLWHGRERGFAVSAVTVDHGLRPEAAAEAARVADFCGARDIPHDILHWKWDGQGNLQAVARDARFALMSEWAKARGADQIALGHTRDDQAETFLMRLARHSGIDGLSQMAHSFQRAGANWLRPLLEFGREELRSYLQGEGITWCEDPSNEDPKYDRVRAREALKLLSPLGIDAHALSQASSYIGSARDAVDHYMRDEVKRLVCFDGGDLVVETRARPPVHPEIGRRLLIAALRYVAGRAYAPRASGLIELEAALSLSGTGTLHGCLVTRSSTSLRVTREFHAVEHLECPTTQVWDGRWAMDGPHAPDLTLRALGEKGLSQCPDWRGTNLPRSSLFATPAIWRGLDLIAAPVAGFANGWSATLRPSFAEFLDIH